MQEYLINFFIWYYLIRVQKYIHYQVIERFIYLLNRTDTLPMAQNLFHPLFQDNSFSGRFIGFFIRFWWITIGIIVSILLIVPNIVISIILVTLPFIPIIILFSFLVK